MLTTLKEEDKTKFSILFIYTLFINLYFHDFV